MYKSLKVSWVYVQVKHELKDVGLSCQSWYERVANPHVQVHKLLSKILKTEKL